jgi:WD40 repeat protein
LVRLAQFRQVLRRRHRFPPPKSIFTDVKYKEPKEKSAIEFGPGNTIIVRGEGTGSPKTFNVLSFSADGKLLAAGKNFGRVVVWHMPSQQILCAIEGSQGQVTAVAFSSDGQFLATTGQGDKLSLKLWHLPECKLAHTYRFTHSFIKSLAFVPKSSSLVVWDNASTTHVLNSNTEDPPLELKGAFRPVLSEDGTMMITTNMAEFALRRTSDWTQQRTLPRGPQQPFVLTFDLQSDRLVAASLLPGRFEVRRISTGETLPNGPQPPLPKYDGSSEGFVAIRPDTSLVFGAIGGRLWVWDIENGQTCVSDEMYNGSGALSPDGTILVGGRSNSILRPNEAPEGIWLWETKELLTNCGFTAGGTK